MSGKKSSCMASTSGEDGTFGGETPYHPIGEKVREHVQNDSALQMLKWINIFLSAIFLAQIVVYAVISLPADVHPTVGDPVDCSDDLCSSNQKDVGELNIQFVFPLIMAVSYFQHLIFFMQCHFYDTKVRRWFFVFETNPLRWIDYAVTVSLQVVVVAILVGVEDVHLWFLLYFSTAVSMGLGQVLDLVPKVERPDLYPVSFRFLRGTVYAHMVVTLVVPWAVLLCYYGRAVDAHLPGFVHVAFWGSFVSCGALVAVPLYHKIMRRCDFTTTETYYLHLSLLAKTFLAVTVYIGLNV